MCTPCRADTQMEIHFEPPLDKSFLNLYVFTIKWVEPLIKAYIQITDSLVVRAAEKKKKKQELWN